MLKITAGGRQQKKRYNGKKERTQKNRDRATAKIYVATVDSGRVRFFFFMRKLKISHPF